MHDDADELLRRVPRQGGVRVEGDAIADGRQNLQRSDLHRKARLLRAAQQTIELLDLPALALPAHPDLIALVPAALAVEQKEAAAFGGGAPLVQRRDAVLGGPNEAGVVGSFAVRRVDAVAQNREMNARIGVRQRRDLQPFEQFLDLRDRSQQHRDDDHRAGVCGQPFLELETQESPRADDQRHEPLDDDNRDFTGGHQEQQPDPELHRQVTARPRDIINSERGDQRGKNRDRAEVAGGWRVGEDSSCATGQRRPVTNIRFEIAAAVADQMVANVCGAIGHRAGFRRLTRAFNRAKRNPDLRLARRRGELFHCLPFAIAAEEIHRAVDPGRIALQHLLDEADGLEVVAPVERRAQAQARQHVGHRHQRRGLPLVLVSDRVFRRHLTGAQMLFDRRVQDRKARAVLARSLQEPDDGGRVEGFGQRRERQTRLAASHRRIGRQPRHSRREDLVDQAPEIFDERQLQNARPRPQLTDTERRHRLVAVHEPDELGAVEAAVAVSNQLERHRIDSRVARPLTLWQPWQLAVVGLRQVMADGTNLGGHQGEMVQQPFGRRRDGLLAVHIASERVVRRAQHPGVFRQPGR